jgi:hypothetical protein
MMIYDSDSIKLYKTKGKVADLEEKLQTKLLVMEQLGLVIRVWRRHMECSNDVNYIHPI